MPDGMPARAGMPGQGQHRTKSDIAKQYIQEQILSGASKPGTHVTTRVVSEALGISETPVREALRGLAAEGWLVSHPHHGSVVASLQGGQLTEIYAIRGALGAISVELGGPHYTSRQLAELERNIRQSETVVASGNVNRYIVLNRGFHMLLADTPDTQWTLRLLTTLWGQTTAVGRGFRLVPGRLRQSLEEHRAILHAIVAKQYTEAAALLIRHERLAGAELLAALGAASPK